MEDIEYHYIDNETGDVHSSLLLYGNGHVLRGLIEKRISGGQQ